MGSNVSKGGGQDHVSAVWELDGDIAGHAQYIGCVLRRTWIILAFVLSFHYVRTYVIQTLTYARSLFIPGAAIDVYANHFDVIYYLVHFPDKFDLLFGK